MVVSKETWEEVKDSCEGEPRKNDFLVTNVIDGFEIPDAEKNNQFLPFSIEEKLRAYIPPVVQNRLGLFLEI